MTRIFCYLSFFSVSLLAANTSVLFQPGNPLIGPFPTNSLTSENPLQQTGLQVNLPPPPGCNGPSSSTACVNALLENQLDGFSLNPRITVCFSGPVNTTTLQGAIAISAVGSESPAIGIDQILFDPVGNCAYAKLSQVLKQQTTYLLTVDSSLRDTTGASLSADSSFSSCVKHGDTDYCKALGKVLKKFDDSPSASVIAASLFTSMSATTWLEKARAAVNSPSMPSFFLPAGPVSTFTLSSVQSITWKPQSGVSGVNYDQALPLNVLGGVDRISFGLFLSPTYLNLSGPQAGSISTTPTNSPLSQPTQLAPVSFHVFLPPASSAPSGGFPLIVYGHGLGDSQFGAPTFAAGAWAKKGFATLAMEITGHGYGPLGTTEVKSSNGTFTELTPGRGIQFSAASPIGAEDGCVLPNAIATRDCSRQTAVDLSALIRVIRQTKGLGVNIDPSRIYYVGQSFGSFYGTLLEAVEPNMGPGTFNGWGGTQVDVARLSPIARQLGAVYLGGFSPSLLNVPPAPSEAYFHDRFNDEYVYRGQVVTDNVPGALAIQAAFESAEWLGMLGDPLSYAGHLKTDPLKGVPAKQILVQFGLGDLEVPNPTASAVVRAAGLESSSWMLNTLAVAAIDPAVLGLIQPGVPYPIYPHRFLSNPTIFQDPVEAQIALAAQNQIADFYKSGGVVITDPNSYLSLGLPFPLFQIPNPLPDRLNFIQIQP
jgi:hypothetical protein